MGRKNTNARDLSVQERRRATPNQMAREAEKARFLLHSVFEPYATPKEFTFSVGDTVSPSVLRELQAVYAKDN